MSQPTLTRWWRGAAVLTAVLAVIAATLLAGRPDARAVSADIVISQIYGGGGNSGATLRNDFIELFNRGASPVSVTGWSVQWASATTNVWQVTSLTGTIQPGAHYLVQQAAGAGGSVNLPTPDATGTIMMGATSGKAALVTNTTALTCGAGPTCLPSAAIRDFVGYGATADNFEGAAPTGAAPSNTTAVLRAAAGCTDTDQNSADFTAAVPNPRNSASTVAPCAPGTPGPSPSGSPGGSPGSTPTPTPTAGAAMRIRDIQGVAHTSPRLGQIVAGVPGIVTVRRANGFYVQDPSPDANPGTSEGIFVFTSSAPSVNVGDSVLVSGTVSEFRGGCNPSCDPAAGAFDNLTITQIGAPSLHVSVRSSGNPLPPATVIGSGGRVPPSTVIDDDATGNVETSGSFDIADGIDFYESLEGMRVQVNNAVAVGPRTDFSNDASEIPVLADNGAGASVRTARGGIIIRPTDFNPERIILATATSATPPINVSDRFPGATVGVIDYTFGNFKLLVTTLPAFTSGGITPESATPALPNQLSIATFNVENLDPNDSGLKFTQLASVIVNNLKAPDIIAVEEIQDNNGPVNDAIVDATVTFNTLISAITGAGGPAYQFRQINPVDDQDGGEPGGNIRVGFLFRTDRGLTFVDRPKGDSTGGGPAIATAVVNTPDGPQLSASPGRIDPANLAFTTSRKPLAGEFQFGVKGPKVFVIANHFNSKGGDDPLFGRFQPPVRITETQRHQQAQVLNSFVASLLTADPNANVVVAGDFNDFDFSQTLSILRGTQLFNLFDTLPAAERYSYVFEGNSQTLDHILVSRNLLQNTQIQYDVVHVNSEFANQISDHEPQVARITFTAPPPTPAPNVSPAPKPVPGAGPTPAPSPTPSSTPSPTAIPSPTPTAAPTTTPKPGPMLPTATPAPTPGPTMTPKAVPGLARHNAPAPWIAAAHPIGRIMRQESQRSLIAASPLTPLNLALKLA